MLDGVREVDVLARDAGAFQPAIEHAAGGSDERVTLEILAITRRLATSISWRAVALAHHGLRGGLPQVARAAFLDGLAEVRQRGARRDRGWRVFGLHGGHPLRPLPSR